MWPFPRSLVRVPRVVTSVVTVTVTVTEITAAMVMATVHGSLRR